MVRHHRERTGRHRTLTRLAAAGLTISLVAACGPKRKLPKEFPESPTMNVVTAVTEGPLARLVERLRPRLGPEESAFLLMDDTAEALRWRLMRIDSAVESLDIQYFFWYDDESGNLLAERVLAAADRGVRVRVLLDDLKTGGKSDEAAVIVSQHPNVHIKLFNPFRSRERGQLTEFLGSMRELNQRMHNKILAADGHVAIVGGRNLANHYWGLGDKFNSIDHDLLVAGPAAADLGDSFDVYWNHELSYPGEALGLEASPEQLAERRAALREEVAGYRDILQAFAIEPQDWSDRLETLPDRMIVARSVVIYDTPAVGKKERATQMYEILSEGIGKVIEEEIVIASAFFVPQHEMVDGTLDAVDRGIRVRVLTNSLASNPGTVSHAGYKRYRRALLLAGAELWELRPDAALKSEYETAPRQGAFLGLHTKAIVVDRRYAYVGSLNVDPRSTLLNTEVGMVVDSEELAGQLLASIERAMTPENSWQARLNDKKKVEWVSSDGVLHREPARDKMQRFLTWMVGVFANENWL